MAAYVIPPLAITDAIFTSSTIAEPDTDLGEATYDVGTPYALADQAISTVTHRKFESRQASNTGNALPVWPDTVNDWWLDIGPTNKWAAVDLLRNTGSVGPTPLVIELSPVQRINAVGMAGIIADQVVLSLSVDAVEIWTRTFNLSTREVLGWYDWLTKPFELRPTLSAFDVPAVTGSKLTITATRATGDVTIGGIVIGRSVYLGETVVEPESDQRNFSTVERSFDGTATMTQRRSIPTSSQSIIAPAANVNAIRQARRDLNAQVGFWSWIDDQDSPYFDAGVILGFATRFLIRMDSPAPGLATTNLDTEEV